MIQEQQKQALERRFGILGKADGRPSELERAALAHKHNTVLVKCKLCVCDLVAVLVVVGIVLCRRVLVDDLVDVLHPLKDGDRIAQQFRTIELLENEVIILIVKRPQFLVNRVPVCLVAAAGMGDVDHRDTPDQILKGCL